MSRDQAASLRAWALDRVRDSENDALPTGPLLVIAGLPGFGRQQADCVIDRMQRWADRGFCWVGDPFQWQLVWLEKEAAATSGVAKTSKRWALWIDTDIHAFEKGYHGLKLMQSRGAPSRVLALHEPGLPRKGLLDNLRNTAAVYCGIDLAVLAS